MSGWMGRNRLPHSTIIKKLSEYSHNGEAKLMNILIEQKEYWVMQNVAFFFFKLNSEEEEESILFENVEMGFFDS